MNSREWEHARVEAFNDLLWQQTEGNPYRYDFNALARQLDERVPPSLLMDESVFRYGRNADIDLEFPCIYPACSLVFTRRDNRRVHYMRDHTLEKRTA